LRNTEHRNRLFVIFLVFIAVFAIFTLRLVSIQVFKSYSLTKLAYNQHNILIELPPERGDILDRASHKLAVDRNVYSLSASPDLISEDKKEDYADELSGILEMDRAEILARLKSDKTFVWIRRELEKDTSDKVEGLRLRGLKLAKERKRFYPNGKLASHVIGFAGIDDTGLEGVELAYDGYLKGTPGFRWTIKDAKRRNILSKDLKVIPPSDGLDLVLTIDETIQHIAESRLDKAYADSKAASATIIVMDPHNGDILALANRPTYDINDFSSTERSAMRNRAVTDIYEPGSIFKIVTASCAVENGVASPTQEFFCENGEYATGGRILHDHEPYETLTFSEIIARSSNIGVTKIAELLGKDEISRYIKLFGFGRPTGIDMPGEAKGIVRPARDWSGVSISAIPIGQGVAVTSMQMISAISIIANGGYLVTPRVVSEIRDKSGNVIKKNSSAVVRPILRKRTADIMKDILKSAVEDGTGMNARLERYTSAGKTGTAQKVEPGGGYSHKRFVASFAGFAPAGDPRIAILVTLDEPGPVYYGGAVAAPVFKDVARDVLRYLRVDPDRPEGTVDI